MKKNNIIFPALAAIIFVASLQSATAQDPAESKPAVVTLDFEDQELGSVSDDIAFVVDGDFSVVAKGDNKVLESAATPLVESGALVGANIEGDVVISAKIHATKRGRSYPRFGIGTHGMSGYRLRVVPARKIVELFYRDEQVAEAPFHWESDTWTNFQLSVKKGEGEAWEITGYVWKDGEDEPAEATISHAGSDLRGKGKASIWGTPYSGTPIAYDDISVRGNPAP